MKLKEVLGLDHLKIAEKGKFVHIHAEEGYVITSCLVDESDEDSILEYNGSECYYMPIIEDYPDYRIITLDEHLKYEKMRDEIREKRDKEEREKMKELMEIKEVENEQ